jgi:hypothetical protein
MSVVHYMGERRKRVLAIGDDELGVRRQRVVGGCRGKGTCGNAQYSVNSPGSLAVGDDDDALSEVAEGGARAGVPGNSRR